MNNGWTTQLQDWGESLICKNPGKKGKERRLKRNVMKKSHEGVKKKKSIEKGEGGGNVLRKHIRRGAPILSGGRVGYGGQVQGNFNLTQKQEDKLEVWHPGGKKGELNAQRGGSVQTGGVSQW